LLFSKGLLGLKVLDIGINKVKENAPRAVVHFLVAVDTFYRLFVVGSVLAFPNQKIYRYIKYLGHFGHHLNR